MSKQCSKCKKEKKEDMFNKDKKFEDGLCIWCKECISKYRAQPKAKKYRKEYHTRPETKQREKRYRMQPKVKQRKKKYWEEYRIRPGMEEHRKEYAKKYARTKGKQRWKRYYARPRVKERLKEALYKRYDIGFISIMNNPFPNDIQIDYHHVDGLRMPFVIPVPTSVHRSMYGCCHYSKMKQWIINNLLFDLDEFIGIKIGCDSR